MFKFNNKDTRTTSVSITNSKQVNTGQSVTPLNQIQQLYEVLDISRVIAAENSPLHIASGQMPTGILDYGAQVANH